MTHNGSPAAVVVGLNDASLSIIRSLGRRGIRVVGLHEAKTKAYYLKSRYLSSTLQSDLRGKELISTLKDAVALRMHQPAVLFCASDGSVLTLSEHAEELRDSFRFVIPPHAVASRQISKKGIYDFAVENGFPIPKTYFTTSAHELIGAAAAVSYPCIVKPEYRDEAWDRQVPEKVLFVRCKEDLLRYVEEHRIADRSLVIQEWIDGGDSDVYFCLAYLNREGKPVALCTARKLRQYPHLTGSTSAAETVALPDLAAESVRFLREAGCVGFCSMEYKRSKDGTYYITEPTVGRPDTQEGIMLSSGLDAPYIAYCDAIGREPETKDMTAEKVTWINEPLFFYSLQESVRDGSGVRNLLKLCKGKRTYALWASDDPLPALVFWREKVMNAIGRVSRRLTADVHGGRHGIVRGTLR